MLTTVPFEYPAQFLASLASGDVIRYGTLLKDAATGHIVGHMQETSAAQLFLSSMDASLLSPLTAVSDAVNAGASIYAGVQMEALKSMLVTLQSLQVATLGVSLVGIGVSVAGFAYMRKRFNSLDSRIDQVIDAVNTGFALQRHADLRVHVSRIKSLIQRAEHAQKFTSPQIEYANVASGLVEHSAYLEGELTFMVATKDPINHALFWQLVQLWMVCNNVRIDCEIRINELRHALAVAQDVSSEYQKLFTRLTPVSFDQSVADGLSTIRVLRDASDAAASKPYLIDFLRTRRISGADYIESLDQEKKIPYLLLRLRT